MAMGGDQATVSGRGPWLCLLPGVLRTAAPIIFPTGKLSSSAMAQQREDKMSSVKMTVNGKAVSKDVADTTLLSEFLRETLRLTGTHVGCDTSQCGACVVHVNGKAVKSCTALAVSLDGADVTTIEGVADGASLHPMQQAFNTHHGLQCGFCTPGMIMTGIDMVNRYQADGKALTPEAIRHELEGNICRCTGYHNIVKAIEDAAGQMTAPAQAAE